MADIVLLTKKDEWSKAAQKLARSMFPDVQILAGDRTQPFPDDLNWLPDGKTLISFLSPWIVPEHILRKFKTAINFHPGSSAYPGIGCYNFALYENAKRYGAVCHFMEPKVDTGAIIAERVFYLSQNETVESLKLRTMVTMISMFHDVLSMTILGDQLEPCNISWSRKPFKRQELDALCLIRSDMTANEIARRVRATTYPKFPGPYVEIGGVKFLAPVPQHDPLA